MASNTHYKLLIQDAEQVVCICENQERFLVGKQMNEPKIIKGGSIVVGLDGKIVAVGAAEHIQEQFKDATFDKVISAKNQSIIPGLVDAHTHPVWAGDRVHEFAMKLAGATYMEIHAKGGGIQFTVEHTSKASEDDLLKLLRERLSKALRSGTTLIETKSGYGLQLDLEMRLLKVLHRATVEKDAKHVTPDIVSNYLAAHSVPKGSTSRQATDDIVNNQIPVLAELIKKGEISPTLIDVFLEKGVFNKEETKEILEAGKKIGLQANFHGDEINPMESGELAGELSALAVSHLERVSKEGIEAMAREHSFAVLLPSTAYILRIEPAPARELIEHGVPVALGSDFNPNAHCISMPFIMNLACVNMRMTMNESLVAATLNAAGSMNKSDTHGSIEQGKWADFVIINSANWEHIIYEIGEPPINYVILHGDVVVNNQ